MRSSLRRIGVITFASLSLVAVAALPASAAVGKPMPASIKLSSQTCGANHMAIVTFTVTLTNSPSHRVESANWYLDGGAPLGNNSVDIPQADPKLLTKKTTTISYPIVVANQTQRKPKIRVIQTHAGAANTTNDKTLLLKVCA